MSEPTDKLARQLAELRPAPGPNRDRLLFEAGRRSAQPGRFWPAVSGVLAVVCVGLAVRLWFAEPPTPTPVIVMPAPTPSPAPTPTPSLEPTESASADEAVREALRIRREVWEHGVDALPPAVLSSPSDSPRDFSLGGMP